MIKLWEKEVSVWNWRCWHLMTTTRCPWFTHLFFFFFFSPLFSYHLVCPHGHVQQSVVMVCASMAASVGRDPHSSVTVLQGSTDPAASMVSRNILSVSSTIFLFCALLYFTIRFVIIKHLLYLCKWILPMSIFHQFVMYSVKFEKWS